MDQNTPTPQPSGEHAPDHQASANHPKMQTFLAVMLLLAGTALAYWGVWEFDFIDLDDPPYITDNPAVQQGLTPEFFQWAFQDSLGDVPHYIPLVWVAIAAQHAAFGDWAGGYHVVNVVIHALNILLCFFLARRLGGTVAMAFLGAGLFGLHPLRVESVAWVVEIKDVLSSMFWLLCLHAYVWWVQTKRPLALAASLGAMVLGGLSKPMLATLPVTLLLLDIWPLGRSPWWQKPGAAAASWWALLREKWHFFLLGLIIGVWAIWTAAHGAMPSLSVWPLEKRLSYALVGSMTYLWKLIWPVNLAPYYPFPKGGLAAWQLLSAGGVFVGVSVLTILLRRRHPALLMAWLWFLLTIAPLSGLLQAGQQLLADRFSYIPLLGIAMAAGWLMARSRALFLAGCVLLAACTVLSFQQTRHWRNAEILWRHAITVTGDSDLALNNLSNFSYRRGDYDEAIALLRRAVEANPRYIDAALNLGRTYRQAGMLEEAAQWFTHMTKQKFPNEIKQRARIHAMLLHVQLEQYDKATEMAKAFGPTPRGQSQAWLSVTRGFLDLRQPALAAVAARMGTEADPTHADAFHAWGVSLASDKRFAEAVPAFAEAVRLAPDNQQFKQHLERATRDAATAAQGASSTQSP